MDREARNMYRTKFHNLEQMDIRALTWCMQCGNCINDQRSEVGADGTCTVYDFTPGFEPYYSRGKNMIIRALLEGRLEPSQELADAIYECTVCNLCNHMCHNTWDEIEDGGTSSFPVHRVMDHAAVYEALRADLMELGFEHRPGHKVLLASVKQNDNPWGQPRRAKADWTRIYKPGGKNLAKKKENIDVLYFTGCTAALDRTLTDVVISTAQCLDKAGVNWGFLGANEVECGSILMRVGEREEFKRVAKHNVNAFNELYDEYGCKTIITSCAGCFKTIFQDYPEWHEEIGGVVKPEVIHTFDFLLRLVKEGKLKLKHEINAKVTYHDSCHNGRHCGYFETPRELVNEIPGINLIEMARNGKEARCCGAGGGVKSGFGDLATNISLDRVKEAEETGADFLINNCPFCEQNFRDGIIGLKSELKNYDSVQLVAVSCGAKPVEELRPLGS
jgi:Fe-S oxidoreductase